MATTPFIRPLQITGGTFYSFTSATQDLALTFNNDNTKFRFSNFALLNIPMFGTPANGENFVQLLAPDGAMIQGPVADINVGFAQSFENYCLNLEATIISQPTYDQTNLQSVAERVFFKWLKELGVMRYQQATSAESTLNPVTNPQFREQPEVSTGSNRYNPVVQYIGAIDVVNNVQNNVNAYTEVYIYVPASSGSTPLVLFNSVQDDNYYPGMVLVIEPTNPLDNKTIFGRHYTDVNPSGLSTLAIYDQDALGEPLSYLMPGMTPEHWYDPLHGPNAYFTDLTNINTFNDPTTDTWQKDYLLETVTYQRSRLDGVCIDWNPSDYQPIASNPSITTIDQFNATSNATNFEFNCVLLYYDKYDPNNINNNSTNLYGVLFLEDVQQIDLLNGIPTFAKYIPNPITNTNGNSYGYKINLKFDTSVDNVGTEQAINDYSAFSLSMFIDVMNTLQNAADILNDKSAEIDSVVTQVAGIQDNLLNLTPQWSSLSLQVNNIADSLAASQALLANSNAVMDLINKNAADLAALAQGQTSIAVSYNINAVKAGSGIFVDRSVPNQVIIDNINQDFNIQSAVPYQGNIVAGATLALQPYTNYFQHYASGLNLTANGDITVKFDDTVNQWQLGQKYRLVFQDEINMGSNSLILLTDAPNRLGFGNYGIVIGNIPGSTFLASNDTPIFELICVDVTNLVFVINQLA